MSNALDTAERIARLEDALWTLHARRGDYHARPLVDQVLAEVRALAGDAERLDWLEAHGESVAWIDPESDASACHLVYTATADSEPDDAGGATLREAIDDAMRAVAPPTQCPACGELEPPCACQMADNHAAHEEFLRESAALDAARGAHD